MASEPGQPRALVITGATATGKTAVAIEVALRLRGVVISMDSRQVYRGMDIGTAKPDIVERRGVPHFGFDLVEPSERFNAGRFAGLARGWIDAALAAGRVPVLAGGTGFFLRTLTHPMFAEPPLDAMAKEGWKRYLRVFETAELARWADALDPRAAARTRDRQRLARIVEVAVMTGRPLSWWHRHAVPEEPALDPFIVVLELPRDVLYRRIEERVDRMIARGLVGEVRRLIDAGFDERDPGMNATGYIELVPYLRDERSLEDAVASIKAATRRYARRQHTWLRHQLPEGALRLDATNDVARLAAHVVQAWMGGRE